MTMMTDYKATPEQWEVQEKFAPESEDACCLLELRSRIERLELGAGIHDIVSKELKNSLLPDQKRSLIQRVHSCIVGEPECGHMQARAVIREVANWLREQPGDVRLFNAGLALDKEAAQ
jgi:hypothetical protein